MISPARQSGDGSDNLTIHVWMRAVTAIEVDPLPVDEGITAPDGCRPQRVEFIENPNMAAADASCTRIESHGQSFAGDIVPIRSNLNAAGEKRAVVVDAPRFNQRWLGAATAARWQCGQILGSDGCILRRIFIFEERFSNVMNHVVFLTWHHPTLGDHLPSTQRQRAIHRMGIGPKLAFAFRKSQRRWERTGGGKRAMTIGTDTAIEFFTTGQCCARLLNVSPLGDKACVVDFPFVCRRNWWG